MRTRIEQERAEFDHGSRIHVRLVHLKLLHRSCLTCSSPTLRVELANLDSHAKQPGIKLGIKSLFADSPPGAIPQQAQSLSDDIQAMLSALFRQLNTEFSFSRNCPKNRRCCVS
jgi:hypothetical protein